MKKNTTLELIEQSSKVSLYSISFEMDHTTEFERFMCKFESESTLNKDYQKIIYALQWLTIFALYRLRLAGFVYIV